MIPYIPLLNRRPRRPRRSRGVGPAAQLPTAGVTVLSVEVTEDGCRVISTSTRELVVV